MQSKIKLSSRKQFFINHHTYAVLAWLLFAAIIVLEITEKYVEFELR